MATVVLPGDTIPPRALPLGTGKKKTLTLGPGLHHIPPSTVAATIAGALTTDHKKNAAAVEANTGRYTPFPNDLVIATVAASAAETFHCLLSPHTPYATLPHLAFEGATKKTRPQLAPGSLVYARVAATGKDLPPELSCVDPSTGKSEGLGLLKGGMVFSISLSMARRMLAARGAGVPLLEALGAKVGFEVTIGRNGVVHVEAGDVRTTLAVGRAIQEADDQALGEEAQRRLAATALKTL